MVNVLGLSGLRNAYRSVLSAVGSSEISGASRWLDAVLELGASRPMNNAVSPAAAATRSSSAYFFISRGSFLVDGRVAWSGMWPSSRHIRPTGGTGSFPLGLHVRTAYACPAARRAANGTERRSRAASPLWTAGEPLVPPRGPLVV